MVLGHATFQARTLIDFASMDSNVEDEGLPERPDGTEGVPELPKPTFGFNGKVRRRGPVTGAGRRGSGTCRDVWALARAVAPPPRPLPGLHPAPSHVGGNRTHRPCVGSSAQVCVKGRVMHRSGACPAAVEPALAGRAFAGVSWW